VGFKKDVIIKSSSDNVKAKTNPEMIPGKICGRMTKRKAFRVVAPKSRAA
jgi:hypothetical protein